MLQLLELLRRLFFFSGYLSNESFPRPLSRAEEQQAIAQYAAGDMEARDRLIEHNLRLVAHIAKKYAAGPTQLDDFISIGTIGLIKGVNTFRPERGTQLVTYIARCIENEILMFLRADKKTVTEVSLSEPIGEDREGNKISLMDVLGTQSPSVEERVEMRMELKDLAQIIPRVLTPRECTVLSLRYGLGGRRMLPQWEIAGRLGISRSYVSRIEKKALQKLARELRRGEQEKNPHRR